MVTPKGDSSSPDTLFGTFRIHLFFILVFGGSLAVLVRTSGTPTPR